MTLFTKKIHNDYLQQPYSSQPEAETTQMSTDIRVDKKCYQLQKRTKLIYCMRSPNRIDFQREGGGRSAPPERVMPCFVICWSQQFGHSATSFRCSGTICLLFSTKKVTKKSCLIFLRGWGLGNGVGKKGAGMLLF